MISRPPAHRGPQGLAVERRDGEPQPGADPQTAPALDALHQPDASCIHCGGRTSLLDNVCLRCRGWHRRTPNP